MPGNEEYFDTDDFRELLNTYEAAMKSGHPPFMDADDLADIADYYETNGDFDRATEVVGYALELYPHATLPNVFKARESLLSNDFERARQYAEQIEDHDDPDYHYLQAEILISEGRIDEADQYLRELLATVPPDEYQDFVKDCANLYIDYDINDKAYEWMLRSKADDSDDFKELMARTLFGLGKYKDSERIFNELIDRHPFSKQYWNALANAQFMNEDYSNAVTSSEYAIAIDPSDPEGLLSKANGLFRLTNYEEALEYYRRYAEIEPGDEAVLLHQGVCLANLNRMEEAIDVLQEARQTAEPDSVILVHIYQELAFCYSHLHQIDEAMQMLDKTLNMDCDHIESMVIKGHLLLENGLVDRALNEFKTAVICSDSAPDVLLRIIVSLYDNHYVKACYEMFRRFFNYVEQTDDHFSNGYAYMALCCYDMGKADEFLSNLKTAVARNPHEARLVLGFLFPEDMEPKDYYDYIYKQLKQ